MKTKHRWKMMRKWSFLTLGCLLGVLNPLTHEPVEATSLGGPSHIGTFDGSTTFTTSSSNGINPGLYLEVMDEYGNYTEYTSEDGVITIPDTLEGAYVTQAKLLGKTKYRDQDTGELLDEWEAGRNLTLESVQMPDLKTTGKNLFNGYNEFIKVNHSEKLYLSSSDTTGATRILLTAYDENKNLITSQSAISSNNAFYHRAVDNKWMLSSNKSQLNTQLTLSDDVKYVVFETLNGLYMEYENIQLEESSVATSYEPFKSNILTVNEDVELRGIGDVRDTLDLLTGEVTQRIGEIVLDGSENWVNSDNSLTNTHRFSIALPDFKSSGLLFNDGGFKNITSGTSSDDTKNIQMSGTSLYLRIDRSVADNVFALKDYLSKNNLTVYGELTENSIKTVVLNSTYHFKPVDTREILVEGSILPLICSVTTPTTPLSFVLNPNAEEGQRFIAPEFTIRNQTPSAVSVELKQFTQVTDVLNDVLPTKYENWNHLNKQESKDFALALVPLASDGWESLLEGPRYVKDNSNYVLGTIKAESSVDFTFEALHGRAFTQALDPQYRLVLVFDF